MDHDDFLEPHALHRFAEAILQDQPDMLYSDEAIAGEDIEEIRHISARPAFSYDYYLSHPYFVHLIAARTEIIRRVGGLNEAMTISQDVDLVLRLFEVCRVVTHVPEVLYRWRTHAGSLGHQQQNKVYSMTRGALERHFTRMGLKVQFDDRSHFNFRNLSFQHAAQARVAILIPTKNRCDLLHACITCLERTIDSSIYDIVIVDCESDHSNTTAYLTELSTKHRVLRHQGVHNPAAIYNTSVAAVRGPYTHYLFLANDTEAIDPGWLEHMLGYGQRTDVGIVGALLLSEDELVRHGGVIVGMNGLADHAHKDSPFRGWLSGRNPGHNGGLLATRDVSAVSGACMLTQADLFHRLNGFDERLAGGFSDVDYCLRANALGYKVIQDAYAILYQLEGERSPLDPVDQHNDASLLFRELHRELIFKGDPFHSPMLSRYSKDTRFEPPVPSGKKPRIRTTRVVLPPPTPTAVGKITRFDAEATGDLSPRPHLAIRPGLSSVTADSLKPSSVRCE
jgi:GT2 family glycosyltransferase